MRRKNNPLFGFSLIEVMMVLAIGSLVIAAIVVATNYTRSYSTDKSNVRYLIKAKQIAEQFYGYYNYYPNVSCNGGSGFEKVGTIDKLLTFTSNIDFLKEDSLSLLADIKKENSDWSSKFGYCSNAASMSNAYILIVKTPTDGDCRDVDNNGLYITGEGNYFDTSNNSVDYQYLARSILSLKDLKSSCFK